MRYLFSLLLLPLPALATPLSQEGETFKSWVITCLAVFLIGGVVFLLTRKRARIAGLRGGAMRVQSVLSLGMKEKLILVQVDDQRLLLGVTQQQITLISDLTPVSHQSTPDTFAQRFEAAEAPGASDEGNR